MTKHCQHCNKDFVNQSTLTRHNIAKHADKIPAFIYHEHRCLICGTKFVRKDALRRHNLSKHTLDQMKRCQFCQANFRRDYFPRHESTCARKYWAKFCMNADLTKGIQDDQSNEISQRSPTRRDVSPDLTPVKARDTGLRVVREIDIDTRLASRAFDFVFVHCAETGDAKSLSEAITAGFRHSVPIKPPKDLGVHLINFQFYPLFRLATNVGEYVCGETDINDEDYAGDTLLNRACIAGTASLLEPSFWRGADFNDRTLLSAIRSKSFDTVRFCLALGAHPNNYSPDCNDGKSPLTLASAEPETSHIVPLLIEYGATVFTRDYNGETPLHKAAQRADVDLFHVLLAEDSSPDFLDAKNEDGYSALCVAVQSIDDFGLPPDQVLDFATALLDAGAEANWHNYYGFALFCAVRSGCGAIVRLLLDRQPESPRTLEKLNEALMMAIYDKCECVDIIEMFVEAGATVNEEVLKWALRRTNLEVVESLLKSGVRAYHVGDVALSLLSNAARDQRLSGKKGTKYAPFDDAVARYELLCLYFPDDERLRDLDSGTDVEDHGI